MSHNACVICGGIIPEGWQVCPSCEQKFKPHAHIVEAMLHGVPVEYNGDKYGCISALIIRARASHLRAPYVRYTVQAELMSARNHNVVIVDPKEIKILKEHEK